MAPSEATSNRVRAVDEGAVAGVPSRAGCARSEAHAELGYSLRWPNVCADQPTVGSGNALDDARVAAVARHRARAAEPHAALLADVNTDSRVAESRAALEAVRAHDAWAGAALRVVRARVDRHSVERRNARCERVKPAHVGRVFLPLQVNRRVAGVGRADFGID